MTIKDVVAANYDLEILSTGSLSLDIALGGGGFPRGRIVEIYGPESSGKTTLALQAIAQMQRKAGTAAFVDAECALEAGYARRLGVNMNELLVCRPETGEKAIQIIDMLIRSDSVDLIVIDSVAALTPKAEVENRIGSRRGSLHAQLIGESLDKLAGHIKRSKTTVIFINQLRMQTGVGRGAVETTPAADSLKRHASVRLDIRRIGAIRNGHEVIGDRTRVKVVKNKVASVLRDAEFEILYATGISRESDILDQGIKYGILEKWEGSFRYRQATLGQGREEARTFLMQNPQIGNSIDAEVREMARHIEHQAAINRC